MKALILVLILLSFGTIIAEQPLGFGDSVSVTVIRANSFNYTYLWIAIIGVIFAVVYYYKKKDKKEVYYE